MTNLRSLEVDPRLYQEAIALSARLREQPQTEQKHGVSYPQEVLGDERRTLLSLIDGLGGLTRLMGKGGSLLHHDDLKIIRFDIVPDIPVVVVQSKYSRSWLLGAMESGRPIPQLHTIDIIPNVSADAKWNTQLGFDEAGHVRAVREEGGNALMLGVATVEANRSKAVFALGMPLGETPPAAFVLVFDDCQPAEAGFAGVAAVNVISG